MLVCAGLKDKNGLEKRHKAAQRTVQWLVKRNKICKVLFVCLYVRHNLHWLIAMRVCQHVK